MKLFYATLLSVSLAAASLAANDPINPVTLDTPKGLAAKVISQNDLSTLNALIQITEKHLAMQKGLKNKINDFQALQTQYLQDEENAELLFKVAGSAKSILSDIEECHLAQNFSPEFIKEIQLFSQIAKKRGIPKTR